VIVGRPTFVFRTGEKKWGRQSTAASLDSAVVARKISGFVPAPFQTDGCPAGFQLGSTHATELKNPKSHPQGVDDFGLHRAIAIKRLTDGT
jgi:hypothetical protein